ncbi:hypothetical protein IB286_11260 [Spongiibacter sp. KMU-158]|uniref:Uncharacterized protein n=1 Tax=Spongiibacter pelagi TaxID=2760804 RepID=A0A927C2J0_9GAMM|nr:hypothetical protein [Spongiibacter pelagi]MBD2859584.1 hypothetical protein [Spongiibacter pelagi]
MKKMLSSLFATVCVIAAVTSVNAVAESSTSWAEAPLAAALNENSSLLDGETVSVSLAYSAPGPQGYGFGSRVLKPLAKSRASDEIKQELLALKQAAFEMMPESVVQTTNRQSRYHLQIDVAAQDYIGGEEPVKHKIRFSLSRKGMSRDLVTETYLIESGVSLSSQDVVASLGNVLGKVGVEPALVQSISAVN